MIRIPRTILIAACGAALLSFTAGAAAPLASSATVVTAAPIPIEDVSLQAVSTSDNMRDIAEDLSTDPTTAAVEKDLPSFTREVNARLDESAKLIRTTPSLNILRGQEKMLVRFTETLDDWNNKLTRRSKLLDKQVDHLDQLRETWILTQKDAQGPEAPPAALENIQTSITLVQQTRDMLEQRHIAILVLQNQVAGLDRRVDQAIDAVKQAHTQLVDGLLKRDSPFLWNAKMPAGARPWMEEARASILTQLLALRAYAERQQGKFFMHILLVLFLLALFSWLRRRIPLWVGDEPELRKTVPIFDSPVWIALVLSIFAAGWIYPQAPRLLWALLGAAALIPTTLMLRRLLDRQLFPILNALVVFYFIDQWRLVVAALPLATRWTLLVELIGGTVFLTWWLRTGKAQASVEERGSLWTFVHLVAQIALIFLGIAFLANVLGYVGLSTLLGDTVFRSAYMAIVLYALLRIIEVVLMIALRAWPFTLLEAVNKNRLLVWGRIIYVMEAAAVVWWMSSTLEHLALRDIVWEWGTRAITATAVVGSLELSLGHVLTFCFTVWAAFQVSRFVRFLLEEDVYTRFSLAPGLPYAISMMLHYIILVVGFLAAAAALGFDMTKFTILAGAFGVGLGFGLQNIISNFMSGLILLFERPIKVGDVVQIDDTEGIVHTIGIRATKIRTVSGSEVVVPNGNLISNKVTNWTASTAQRSIEISVSVALTADPGRVIDLLQKTAAAHPLIAKKPAPQAFFTKFGGGSLNFELRAWTDHLDQRQQIRSELIVAVNAALANEKIPVQ